MIFAAEEEEKAVPSPVTIPDVKPTELMGPNEDKTLTDVDPDVPKEGPEIEPENTGEEETIERGDNGYKEISQHCICKGSVVKIK